MDINEVVRNNFLNREKYLSEFATKSCDSIRFRKEDEDFRPAFFHDTDRIIYSFTYARYADKTQVFSFNDNDHITKRMVHVQLVSKIARTIGRALSLNDDLIEAIALSHDLGHTPLGHQGEYILDDICRRELNQRFAHNIQGVRRCMYVDNKGEGLNLSVQVLDGIMCHNGEILSPIYKPMEKDVDEFLREYNSSYESFDYIKKCAPMTLEGCVVRLSDIIGYVGRDLDDAIMLGIIKREDVPKEITSVLGNTNREIVNTIINDIVYNSLNKPYIKMSEDVYNALLMLKKFNTDNIYSKSMTREQIDYYTRGMNKLFAVYLEDLETNNHNSSIYDSFVKFKEGTKYLKITNNKRIVVDYIAGMTDEFFLREVKKYI